MEWVSGMIPVLVPVVIYLLKLVLPMLPKSVLPILAPVLGGVADAIIAYATGSVSNPALGALLGSAGVGLREIVHQLKKVAQG